MTAVASQDRRAAGEQLPLPRAVDEHGVVPAKIVISEGVSLDGGIEGPTGAEGLRVGSCFWETDRGEDGEQFTPDQALHTEALLLGRRSYEFFAATWPSRSGDLADRLNSLPKYVVSSTLEDPRWSNSTVLKGNLVDAVST